MKKFIGVFLLLVVAICFISAPALAFNQRITVYASVPLMRAIYVDDTGNIIKVAGNTTQNIEPAVYDVNNHVVPMTDPIKAKYRQFLESHSWHLEAGKIYKINPLTFDGAGNSRIDTIKPIQTQPTLAL